MEFKKVKDSYNTYTCKMSFGQLVAIRNALEKDHADPVSDEIYAEINYYLNNLPGPGEDPDDFKEEKREGEEAKKKEREEKREAKKSGEEPAKSEPAAKSSPKKPSGEGGGSDALGGLFGKIKQDRQKLAASMQGGPTDPVIQEAAQLLPPPPRT